MKCTKNFFYVGDILHIHTLHVHRQYPQNLEVVLLSGFSLLQLQKNTKIL